MKKQITRIGRLWGTGAVLLLLRLLQNQTGFDAETGLSQFSLPGTLLPVLLLVSVAVELYRSFRTPKRRADFTAVFAPPEGELTALVLGCFLLAAGGVLLALEAFFLGDTAAGVSGVLAVLAGAGLVMLNRQVRAKEELSVMPLLPLLFFSVFFVLAVYLPLEDDPVFARYYLPILTVAMIAYSFSQLAGFCRKESGLRSFLFTADMTVILCLASAADAGLAKRLLYLGCAMILSVYLVLRRETEEIPEDEPEEDKQPVKAKKSKA